MQIEPSSLQARFGGLFCVWAQETKIDRSEKILVFYQFSVWG